MLEIDVIWVDQFAYQTDHTSCGVYILMYVSQKLGREPRTSNVFEIWKEFAGLIEAENFYLLEVLYSQGAKWVNTFAM